MDSLGHTDNLNAYTVALDANTSYLHNTHYMAAPDPLSGSTMGLLMLLSTFQYQAPYMSPTYSNAFTQASKAAYIESGGQAFQDRLGSAATKNATTAVHYVGITDPEMGAVYGGYKVYKIYKAKQLDFNGPKLFSVKTHLTCGQNGGTIGLRWEFK